MSRDLIAAQSPPLAVGRNYYPATPLSANSANLTMTGVNQSGGNYTPIVDGATIVIATNTDSMAAHTITITSSADSLSRKGDITAYSLASGAIAHFGPFKTIGWNGSTPSGLWIDASAVTVTVAVLTIPA